MPGKQKAAHARDNLTGFIHSWCSGEHLQQQVDACGIQPNTLSRLDIKKMYLQKTHHRWAAQSQLSCVNNTTHDPVIRVHFCFSMQMNANKHVLFCKRDLTWQTGLISSVRIGNKTHLMTTHVKWACAQTQICRWFAAKYGTKVKEQ